MTPYGSDWEEELALLFTALPPRVASAAQRLSASRGDLLEIVLDLGREPEARFGDGEVILDPEQVTHADLEYVVAHVAPFGDDNRAGIERTLHRISALRNRAGTIVGLTCRVGRAVTGTIDILRDIIVNGQSVLLLGAPGIGKTTMLRECARVLADDCGKRVVIVDTSNEIAGDGDIPHPGIGRARRMQVKTPPMQHAVMIEAVENHMPQVIVIDEIGTELEAAAARTIAERGVQLIGTAHGTTLENLLVNPTLNDLLGGIQSVTLSDEEARRRGTQKSVLERKAPPTFDALVEIQNRHRVVVHMPLNETVDDALRGRAKPPQLRERDEAGQIVSRIDPGSASRSHIFETNGFDAGGRRGVGGNGHATAPSGGFAGARRGERELPAREPRRASFRAGRTGDRVDDVRYAQHRETGGGFDAGRGILARPSQPIAVFPYGVSRTYLEQSIRDLRLPIRIQHNIDDADIVLTLKNYYRRKDSPVRMAEAAGIPIQVLRSNTVTQVRQALERLYGEGAEDAEIEDPTDEALAETHQAMARVRDTGREVELEPRNAYIRRLQHQLVERNDMFARSIGKDPYRYLVVLPGG